MEGLVVIFSVVVTWIVFTFLRGLNKSAERRIASQRSQRTAQAASPKARPSDQTRVYSDGWEKRNKVEIEPYLSLEAMGESFHIETIRLVDSGRLERGEDAWFRAFLIPEPSNPHDPAATAIWADGFGLVGHIGRSDVWKIRPLRKALLESDSIGVTRAKLVGGWGEEESGRTIPPGVVVYVNDSVPEPENGEGGFELPDDWRTRSRAALSGSKGKDVSVVGEGKYQPALQAIVSRSAISLPVPFDGLLVPSRVDPFEAEPTLVVCAEKEGPVGSLSYATARRYRRAINLLSERGEVGTCPAVCLPEGRGYGVKIRLPSPDDAEAAIVARAIS